MYDTFDKEIIILGISEIVGGHCVENVQLVIEEIVNEYKFNKSKIKGMHNIMSF